MEIEEAQKRWALEVVVRRLLEAVKRQSNLGVNQVVYHKEYYETNQ